MRRSLVIALVATLVAVLLLMGLPVLVPGGATGEPASSMTMLQCLTCAVFVAATARFVLSVVSYLSARQDAVVALCHPHPLVPPPRRG